MLTEIPHWVEVELAKIPTKLTLRQLAKALDVQLVRVGDRDRYPYSGSYGWTTTGTWEKYGSAPTLAAHAFYKRRQNHDAKIIVMYCDDLRLPQVAEAVVHELAHIALDMSDEKSAYEWAVVICERLPKKEMEPLKLGLVNILTTVGVDIDAQESSLLVNFMLKNTQDHRLPEYWRSDDPDPDEEL